MGKKSEKIENDQADIIEALSLGDHVYVWGRVNKIGFKYFADIRERYTIFCGCVNSFDYTQNNNFIKYYMDHLKYSASYNNKTYYTSTNRKIIQKLRNENISPTEDCNKSKITKELRKWSN